MQYNFDEPWDGPNNRKLIDKMPAVYSYPGADGGPSSRTNTSYFVFSGEGTRGPHRRRAARGATIRPSRGMTSRMARRTRSWSSKPTATFLGPSPRTFRSTRTVPYRSWAGLRRTVSMQPSRTGRFVHLKKSINPVTLKALITRAGGEVVSSDSF